MIKLSIPSHRIEEHNQWRQQKYAQGSLRVLRVFVRSARSYRQLESDLQCTYICMYMRHGYSYHIHTDKHTHWRTHTDAKTHRQTHTHTQRERSESQAADTSQHFASHFCFVMKSRCRSEAAKRIKHFASLCKKVNKILSAAESDEFIVAVVRQLAQLTPSS